MRPLSDCYCRQSGKANGIALMFETTECATRTSSFRPPGSSDFHTALRYHGTYYTVNMPKKYSLTRPHILNPLKRTKTDVFVKNPNQNNYESPPKNHK